MVHKHDHHIDSSGEKRLNVAFLIGIVLNVGFVAVEVVFGLLLNSVALLSDAGHNFSDVLSLLIGAVAFFLMKVKPGRKSTYGLKKLTVLAAFVNSVLLMVATGAIIFYSVKRFFHPQQLEAGSIMLVATIGIVINAVSALLFFRDHKKDLNVKAVFWHLVADTLVSVGVVIGAYIIKLTEAYWIDPLIGLIISMVIILSTWTILRDSFLMMIDVAPQGFDVEQIKRLLESDEAVRSVHHVHLWAISTMLVSLTAHIVLDKDYRLTELEEIKRRLKHLLAERGIMHSTIEFESEDFKCEADYEC